MKRALGLWLFLIASGAMAQALGTYGRYPTTSGSGGGGNINAVTGTAPITVVTTGSTAAVSITNPLPIVNGGSGQTTAQAAINALAGLTTKGDLLIDDGTNTTRLAVGTNGYVLTASSAAVGGLQWLAAAGGSSGVTSVTALAGGGLSASPTTGSVVVAVTTVSAASVSGVLATGNIPSLPTSILTSGTIPTASISGVLAAANGGTATSAALVATQVMVVSGAAIVGDSFLTASLAGVGINTPAVPATTALAVKGITNLGIATFTGNTGGNVDGFLITGPNATDSLLSLWNTSGGGHNYKLISNTAGAFVLFDGTASEQPITITSAMNFGLGNITVPTAGIDVASVLNGAGLRLRNNGHIKFTGTAPTAAVRANAGTGATCTVSNATDSAGFISLTTTAVSPGSGAECDVQFNVAYAVSPVCVLTATNAVSANDAVVQGVYLTATTGAVTVSFGQSDVTGRAYTWAYHCLETQ